MVRGIPDPRPPSRWHSPSPALRLYLLTLIISVTAGCGATLETEIVVRDDDSAGVQYELSFQLPDDLPDEATAGINQQLETAQTQAQADVRAETQRLGIDPEAVTFTSFSDDGRLGMRVGIDPVPRERLAAVLALGGADALFRHFTVDRDGGLVTLNAELTGESTLSAPASSGEQFATGNDVLGEQPLSVVIAVRLPGQVTSHNADRVSDDGALEWDGQAEARTLTAQADIGGSSTLALLATAGVLVLAGGLFVLWRRTRGPARAGGAAGWSVTADDPSARGAVFALAPGRTTGASASLEPLTPPADTPHAEPEVPDLVVVPEADLAAPAGDLAAPDQDLGTPEEGLAAPDDGRAVPDEEFAVPEQSLAAPEPAPSVDAAWWLDDDDDDLGPVWDDDDHHLARDEELSPVPVGDELEPAGDDVEWESDDRDPVWDHDVEYPAWDDDRPWDDPAWDADESDADEGDEGERAGGRGSARVQDPSSYRRQ